MLQRFQPSPMCCPGKWPVRLRPKIEAGLHICTRGVIERLDAGFPPPRADMTRALVVDDDPMVCMAIEISLERHGFEVTIESWSRLSEQILRVDKWSLCRD
jgi:hypothetical protein